MSIETEPVTQPEEREEVAPEPTPEAPETAPTVTKKRPGLLRRLSQPFANFFRRRTKTEEAPVAAETDEKPSPEAKIEKSAQKILDDADAATLGEPKSAKKARKERLKHPEKIQIPNDPEEAIAFYAREIDSAEEWRKQNLEQKYRGRFGRLRALASYEYDFDVNEHGETIRNGRNELIGAAIRTVFNRQSRTSAAVAVATGIFLGGLGAPAGLAVLGVAAGRGVVEAWKSYDARRREGREAREAIERGEQAKPEGGLRAEIARLEYERYLSLHEKAKACQEKGISEEEHAERMKAFLEAKNQPNEVVLAKQKEFNDEEAVWNKRRHWGGVIGGLAAAGLGVLHNWHDVMTMKIGGLDSKMAAEMAKQLPVQNGTIDLSSAHNVTYVNGAWHYLYNNAVELTAAQNLHTSVVSELGAHGGHKLLESTSAVIGGAARNLAPTFGALAGLWFGSIGRQKPAERGAEFDQSVQSSKEYNQRQSQFIGNQITQKPESSGGGAGTSKVEKTVAAEPRVPKTTAEWQAFASKEKKPLPKKTGEVWSIINPKTKEQHLFRVDKIDLANNKIEFTALDPNTHAPMMEAGKEVRSEQTLTEFIQRCQLEKGIEAKPVPVDEGKKDEVPVDTEKR